MSRGAIRYSFAANTWLHGCEKHINTWRKCELNEPIKNLLKYPDVRRTIRWYIRISRHILVIFLACNQIMISFILELTTGRLVSIPWGVRPFESGPCADRKAGIRVRTK